MKATGIVRKTDDLGRITIPKEMRRMFEITEGDPLEIYSGDDGEIILIKYTPNRACIFCGSEGTVEHKGRQACAACIKELQNQIKGTCDNV